jgi:hypothetical protein
VEGSTLTGVHIEDLGKVDDGKHIHVIRAIEKQHDQIPDSQDPEKAFHMLLQAAYDVRVHEDKTIHQSAIKPFVLTAMYKKARHEGQTSSVLMNDRDPLARFVFSSTIWLAEPDFHAVATTSCQLPSRRKGNHWQRQRVEGVACGSTACE